jgi:hypothetical protein
MPLEIAEFSPRDFFELLKHNVFSDDFKIFLPDKQKWHDISVDSFDFSFNPSNMGRYGVVTGNVHFDGHPAEIALGPTMAKIVGFNVGCQVTNVNCIRSMLSTATINGGYHEIPAHTNMEVSLLFSYDGRFINNWTNASCEISQKVEKLIEREDMISKKKKTVFDILDFDE